MTLLVWRFLTLFYWLAMGGMWQEYLTTKRFPLWIAIFLSVLGVFVGIITLIDNEDMF